MPRENFLEKRVHTKKFRVLSMGIMCARPTMTFLVFNVKKESLPLGIYQGIHFLFCLWTLPLCPDFYDDCVFIEQRKNRELVLGKQSG